MNSKQKKKVDLEIRQDTISNELSWVQFGHREGLQMWSAKRCCHGVACLEDGAARLPVLGEQVFDKTEGHHSITQRHIWKLDSNIIPMRYNGSDLDTGKAPKIFFQTRLFFLSWRCAFNKKMQFSSSQQKFDFLIFYLGK